MHDGGVRNEPQLLLVEAVLLRIALHQHLQQQQRQLPDAAHVLPRLLVPELNGGGQSLQNRAVQIQNLLGLGGQHLVLGAHQIVELDDISNPAPDKVGHDGLFDDIHRPQIVAQAQALLGVLGGDEEHGQLLKHLPLPQNPQYLKAVHHRHHHVQQHRHNLPRVRVDARQGLPAVGGLQESENRPQR